MLTVHHVQCKAAIGMRPTPLTSYCHLLQDGTSNFQLEVLQSLGSAASQSMSTPSADAAILEELSKCQGQLQQQLHEEAAALEAVRQLEKAQRAAAEAWKTAWNRLEDLQHLKEIHGDLGYMDSYVQTLQPYDHRDDPKLLQPALAAIQALEDGVRSFHPCVPSFSTKEGRQSTRHYYQVVDMLRWYSMM